MAAKKKQQTWLQKNWVWLIVAGVILFALYKLLTKPSAGKDQLTGGLFGSGINPEGSGLDLNKTLKLGVSGAEVTELQKMINKAFDLASYPQGKITIDGQFGSQTYNALNQAMNVGQTTLNDANNYFNSVFGGSGSSSDISVVGGGITQSGFWETLFPGLF